MKIKERNVFEFFSTKITALLMAMIFSTVAFTTIVYASSTKEMTMKAGQVFEVNNTSSSTIPVKVSYTYVGGGFSGFYPYRYDTVIFKTNGTYTIDRYGLQANGVKLKSGEKMRIVSHGIHADYVAKISVPSEYASALSMTDTPVLSVVKMTNGKVYKLNNSFDKPLRVFTSYTYSGELKDYPFRYNFSIYDKNGKLYSNKSNDLVASGTNLKAGERAEITSVGKYEGQKVQHSSVLESGVLPYSEDYVAELMVPYEYRAVFESSNSNDVKAEIQNHATEKPPTTEKPSTNTETPHSVPSRPSTEKLDVRTPNNNTSNKWVLKYLEKVLDLNIEPENINGRLLVSVRDMSNYFADKIDWDGATKTVTITNGKDVIKLKIGEPALTKNGVVVTTDVAPILKNNSTMLPLRAILELLGYKIEVSGMMVEIIKAEPTPVTPAPAPPVVTAPTSSLTQEQVYAKLTSLRPKYEGIPWSMDTKYDYYGINGKRTQGCCAFATMITEEVFGKDYTTHYEIEDIKDLLVGDMVHLKVHYGDGWSQHWVVVLEVRDNEIVVAEGNYGLTNPVVKWNHTMKASDVHFNTDGVRRRY